MTTFFESRQEFRAWMKKHAKTTRSLKIGFRTRPNGHACMAFSDAVAEALRFGWSDGRRVAIDSVTYAMIFRPRKRGTDWNAEHIAIAEALVAKGEMTPEGLKAFEGRGNQAANEAAPTFDFSPMMLAELKRHASAWTMFQKMPPSHRQRLTDWVMSAKQEKTRSIRFARLLMDLSRPKI